MAHFIRIYLRPSVVNPAKTLSAPAHNIRLHPHGLRPTRGTELLPSPLLGEAKINALAKRGPSIEVHVTKESFGSGEMGKVMSGGFVDVVVIA